MQRVTALLITGFPSYKITVALFADRIPGEPFYGFGLRDWIGWILSPSEFVFISVALILEYVLLYFITRRLSLISLAMWGGLLAPYIASLWFPFDLLATVDNLPDRYWPPGLVGAAIELVIFFGVVPALFALGLRFVGRARTNAITV